MSDWEEVLWEPADPTGAREVGTVALKRWLRRHLVDPADVNQRALRIELVKTGDGAAARVMMPASTLCDRR